MVKMTKIKEKLPGKMRRVIKMANKEGARLRIRRRIMINLENKMIL